MGIIILVCMTAWSWWMYFELRATGRRMGYSVKGKFRRKLVVAWLLTIVTAAYLVYLFTAPIGLEYR